MDNVLAATRRDGKAELSFGEGAGAEDARRIARLVRALRGREWVKKVDKRLVEPLLRAHRDAALCDATRDSRAKLEASEAERGRPRDPLDVAAPAVGAPPRARPAPPRAAAGARCPCAPRALPRAPRAAR